MDYGENWRKKRGFTITLINCYSKFGVLLHWSNLAYKDVLKSVSEVRIAVADVVSVGSYFHVSGVRTHDLKEIAKPMDWVSHCIGLTIKRYSLLSSAIICLLFSCEITDVVLNIGKSKMM